MSKTTDSDFPGVIQEQQTNESKLILRWVIYENPVVLLKLLYCRCLVSPAVLCFINYLTCIKFPMLLSFPTGVLSECSSVCWCSLFVLAIYFHTFAHYTPKGVWTTTANCRAANIYVLQQHRRNFLTDKTNMDPAGSSSASWEFVPPLRFHSRKNYQVDSTPWQISLQAKPLISFEIFAIDLPTPAPQLVTWHLLRKSLFHGFLEFYSESYVVALSPEAIFRGLRGFYAFIAGLLNFFPERGTHRVGPQSFIDSGICPTLWVAFTHPSALFFN